MRPKAEDSLALMDTGRRAGPVARASMPQKLGRYQIVHEIGRGAMGTVYAARDPMINREVALKAIPLADQFDADQLEEARAKFFREAEMAGRLNHPHIVTIYDAGEDHGIAYIAMELLRGRHLVDHTSEAKLLPVGVTLSLVARLADALQYAHQRQIVHRDIKPANIMYDAPSNQLKLTDFGIARLTDSGRTRTGVVLGTPSFMSPEQLQGRTLTGQSDLFSLGVTLYQLLTARLPFRADSMPALMMKIAMEPHPRVRAVRPDLPEGIDAVMDRALAKDLSERYFDGAEFAGALRDLVRRIGE
jgi:serine/threonine-protein kinase